MGYVLLFDVGDYAARQAAAFLRDSNHYLDRLVRKHALLQGTNRDTQFLVVPSGKAAPSVADLSDLPEPEPPATSVPLVAQGCTG